MFLINHAQPPVNLQLWQRTDQNLTNQLKGKLTTGFDHKILKNDMCSLLAENSHLTILHLTDGSTKFLDACSTTKTIQLAGQCVQWQRVPVRTKLLRRALLYTDVKQRSLILRLFIYHIYVHMFLSCFSLKFACLLSTCHKCRPLD